MVTEPDDVHLVETDPDDVLLVETGPGALVAAAPEELGALAASGAALSANRHAVAARRAYLGDFDHFAE